MFQVGNLTNTLLFILLKQLDYFSFLFQTSTPSHTVRSSTDSTTNSGPTETTQHNNAEATTMPLTVETTHSVANMIDSVSDSLTDGVSNIIIIYCIFIHVSM